uniref:UPAR/Ly6 domain-containing protein n=1 Tax=Myripristis murdjan TaxID=586833 RepID=A0A668AHY8_9TELE
VQVMGISSLHVDKVCVSTSKCIVGTANYSIHLGSMRVVAAVECSLTVSRLLGFILVPAEPKNNSLQCYSCDSFTCRNKMQCVGMEDRCFNGTGESSCFSELDSMIIPGFNFTDGPTCCEGNFCNSVSTTRLSVFPLLLGLISLIFIY